jgi:TolB-like protein/DNA-binding winged helix-turn-helix (wHTH) protein/Flp pilus assembly protein TadD
MLGGSVLAPGETVSSSSKLALVAQRTAPGAVRFRPFELDLATGELWRNGEAVHLQQQPARVLALLVREAGRLVTREELRRHLWGDDVFVDFQRGLNFCIMQIRDALGDDAEEPRYVETLPRRGYRFIAPLEALEPARPAPEPPADEGPRQPASRRAGWRRLAVRAGLLVALAVAVATSGWTRGGRAVGGPQGATAPPQSVRIAVLPFVAIGSSEGAAIADGLTEEVIVEAGRLAPGRLGVIARSSVARYEGRRIDLARVTSELGVDFVMEGSVRREGHRVRVTARLVRASDQSQAWAETYERTVDDVLGLQREIARAAAAGIGITLDPAARAAASPTLPNPEAWRLYLLGRRAFDERTEEALGRARGHFEAALAIAPDYAPARAGLADVWSVLVDQGQVSPTEGLAKAEALARRALELDPAGDAGHVSLAGVLMAGGRDLPAARRHLERALVLNPTNSLARKWYCWVLADLGHSAEALEQARIGARTDPLSAAVVFNLGAQLIGENRFDEGLAVSKQLLELDGDAMLSHLLRGVALGSVGRVEEAIASLEQAHRLDPRSPLPLEQMTFLHAGAGRTAEARATYGTLRALLPVRPYIKVAVASAAAAVGEREEAFRLLEQAVETREPDLFYVARCPHLAVLRGDPRFATIEKRIAAGLFPARPADRG